MKATLDQTGRIKLPGLVRAQLGLAPGDEVRFEQLEGAWIIRSIPKPNERIEAESDDDDLNWPDLDYQPMSPRRVGELTVNFEYRGRLTPMRLDLDEAS
jgi:bifunctional DNA-binding transcriptional regulator/antitoxin component of YhaV-PrlF toxin-antitoxin module